MNNAVIFGTFDGVHLGHRSVIESVKGNNIIAVTFEIPPRSVIENKQNLLMQKEKREKAMKALGVKEIVMLDFNAVKDISHKEFLEDIVCRFNPAVIGCGFNYRFGKNALGDTGYLDGFCKENGIELRCSEPVRMYDNVVSSSYVRKLVENGLVHKANTLMAADFGFSGEITHGAMRGRTIGFPTINQIYPAELVKTKFGVYKSSVVINNKEYKSITDVGVRPTFRNDKVTAETHILNFSGDLYGKCVELKLKHFMREEIRFSSVEELKAAIENDIKKIR